MITSSFLTQVARSTTERVRAQRELVPYEQMREQAQDSRAPFDFVTRLMQTPRTRIIAEIKRKSPSQGAIAMELDPLAVAGEFVRSGAAALSVLTEPLHFGGRIEDLRAIRRAFPDTLILLKDFVVDPYQIAQARQAGADAVLLIHSLLGPDRLREFYHEALQLGLTPLVEVHDEVELLDSIELGARLIGVNNRNLRTLAIELETSVRLAQMIAKKRPEGITLVSESGLENAQQILSLEALGYGAFLVGTSLLREKNPEKSLLGLLSREASLQGLRSS